MQYNTCVRQREADYYIVFMLLVINDSGIKPDQLCQIVDPRRYFEADMFTSL